MSVAKERFRALFNKSAALRLVHGLASLGLRRTRSLRVMHLLSYKSGRALGPLQAEEALLINAIAQVVQPKVVVEFGFYRGHSALNFLQALGDEATVYSYDVADHAVETARLAFTHFRNFHFIRKSQDDFVPEDINHQQIDLVFLDAAHDLELNQRTWHRIKDHLSERALVIVHDTGTLHRSDLEKFFPEVRPRPAHWINDTEYQHQADERHFVNWVRAEYAYCAVHFHTVRRLRYGITVLQKDRPLETSRTM